MLSKLREQTKFWMWIVGGAFILTIVFAWGMDYTGGGAPTSVGRVNGRKVTIQEYQLALQQAYEYQRDQLGGREMDASMTEFVQEQTWQQLVNEILLSQQLHKMGLGATDEEVLMVLREYPPAFLRQVPNFQTDGVFDRQKYEAAMGNENFRGLWLQAEYLVRDMIPQMKLEQLIAATALVTVDEARELYRYRNEKASARFVRIDPDTRPDSTVTVSDAETQAYYNEHREDYLEPARVDFNYVLLYHDPSPRDLADIQDRLTTIRQRLGEGESFATLARQFSEDPSAADGGDLGWVSKGDMVPTFEETAFEIPVGSYSEPVRTQYGWHVIQVDSIRAAGSDDEQRRMRHILIEEVASPATLDSLQGVLEQLREDSFETDFTTAATLLGLEVQTTGPVTQGGFIPGIGYEPSVTRFGFASGISEVSEVMEHVSAFYIVQVRDRLEEGIAPLADVRSQIRDQLLWDKQMAALSGYAGDLAARMQTNPAAFDRLAEENGLEVAETGSVTRNDFVSSAGRDPQFIAALFTTSIGSVTEAIHGDRAWYILKVLERTEVTSENLDSLVGVERQRILQDRKASAFNTWLQGVRAQAKIVDRRSEIFY